ncbi:MAG TPA: hypothetical protein VFT76_00085 [Actinomycetota bacterium]|nr:hypothetical protein [Actinomycetota bacterium]
MNETLSILLFAACPTGEHVGSVIGTLHPNGKQTIDFPLRYECGCADPRRKERG